MTVTYNFITNDIQCLNNKNIIYKNVHYRRHPIYFDHYFNSINIKKCIRKLSLGFIERNFSVLKDGFREQFKIGEKNHNVSRLILETFKGLSLTNIENECGHINDLPEDNNIENLIWISRTKNNQMAGENALKYRHFRDAIIKYEPYLYEEFCQKYHIVCQKLSVPTNVKIINNIECLYVPVPTYSEIYISIDGTKVFDQKEEKTIWKRDYRCKSYDVCWFNKLRDIKVHHLMAWAKFGYQKFNNLTNMVCHLDDNSENNSYYNIFLGNTTDNGNHQRINTENNKNLYRFCCSK